MAIHCYRVSFQFSDEGSDRERSILFDATSYDEASTMFERHFAGSDDDPILIAICDLDGDSDDATDDDR